MTTAWKDADPDALPKEGVGYIRPALEALGEVEVLNRIHALAPALDGDSDEQAAARVLAQKLERGEVQLAMAAHNLLQEWTGYCLTECGYVEPDDAHMLLLLKVFANLNGWEFEDSGWVDLDRRSRERQERPA